MSPFSPPRRKLGVAVFVLLGVALGVIPPPVLAAPPTRLAEQAVEPASLAPEPRMAVGRDLRLPPGRWSDQRELCGPFRFTMIGFTWRGADHADVGVLSSRGYSRLLGDAHEGPDPDSEESSGVVGTPPLWLDDTDCVRIRVRSPEGEPLRNLRAVFIDSRETSPGLLGSIGQRLVGAWRSLAAPAEAFTPKPRIVTRAGWGANERWRNCGPNYMDSVEVAYIHHTATGNGYSKGDVPSILRGIYGYHTNSLGYCDIAYQFLVDRFGRVFEGRFGGMTKPVEGGHAAGFNKRTVGIAAIGNYTSRTPESALVRSLRSLVAWRLDVAHRRPASRATLTSSYGGGSSKYAAGTNVKMYRVVGHRRTSYTGCPGDKLMSKVGAIRGWADRNGHPKIYNHSSSTSDVVIAEKGSARIQARISKPDTRWRLRIFEPDGTVARSVTRVTRDVDVTWTPSASAPPGEYLVRITARGPLGKARQASLRLRVCTTAAPSTPGRCPSV